MRILPTCKNLILVDKSANICSFIHTLIQYNPIQDSLIMLPRIQLLSRLCGAVSNAFPVHNFAQAKSIALILFEINTRK